MQLPPCGSLRGFWAVLVGLAHLLAAPLNAESIPPGESGGEGALLAIVVDDFGYFYNGTVTGFLSVESPITLSVIPQTAYANRIGEEALAAGKGVIAHMPMEPIDYPAQDPGPGALMVDHEEDTLRALILSALDSFPAFEGVNNHMGSRAMQERRVIELLLEEVSKRDLYFIDSKTIAGELAQEVADSLGIPFGANRLFWDSGYDSKEEILSNLDRLGEVALTTGRAIGIGHPRRVALEALLEKLPELERLGIRLVLLKELVDAPQ